MKVYKPNFESFMAEAHEPVYLQEVNYSKQSDNLTINHRVYLSLTAWNAQDHPIALMIDAGSYLYGDMKEDERVHLQADRIKEDVIKRLKELKVHFLPGVISEKLLASESYRFRDPRLDFELDTAIGSDPDGMPLVDPNTN